MQKIRLTAPEAIIEAAFAQLNTDPSASLALIAQRAGVGRATLHRHFAGRDDLIRAMALQALQEMTDVANDAAVGARSHAMALKRIFLALISSGDRHWFLGQEDLRRFDDVRDVLDSQDSEMTALIESAKQEGLFHADCPTPWIVQSYDHMLHAGWEYVRAGHATPKQAGAMAWTTLCQGLKRTKL